MQQKSSNDDISAKVIRHCFSELVAPLKHFFDLSLSQGIFPDKLKTSKVTLIYETDEKTCLRIIDLLRFFLASQKFYNV